MTFATLTDRRVLSASTTKARRIANDLYTRARSRLQGSPDPHLDDHLLQDIGLTRADYEALRG